MRRAYRHAAVTGTKKGLTDRQRKSLVKVLEQLRLDGYLWLHDGDCIGVDEEAAAIWCKLKGRVMLHPPINKKYRAFFDRATVVCEPRDYLVRDEHMVDCSELLVACPQGFTEERRSGTWATVRYARKLRLRILIIFPDGTTQLTK